jgi:hypothetical protein
MTCLDALSRIAQILTGIAALFISSLALIFAIRESRRKADHDKLAMRPYLVGRSDRQLVSGTQPQVIRFGFNLKNAGLGPARILDMTYSLDGIIQKITEPNDLGDIIMRCLGANAPHDVKSQFVQYGEEFGDDLAFVGGEGFSAMGLKVLRGRRRRFGRRAPGPSRGEVEVAAAVVDGAEFAAGAERSFSRNLPLAASRVSARTLALACFEGDGEVLEGRGEGEELAEAVPAEVVFLQELLDVLRRGAAGTGLEEAAAVHQRDDGQHLGARADLEDREEVGVVVAQDVAGDGDGVLAEDDALEREGQASAGGEDAEVEAGGVVVFEVLLDLGDDLGVVGAGFVEPEDGGRAAERGRG